MRIRFVPALLASSLALFFSANLGMAADKKEEIKALTVTRNHEDKVLPATPEKLDATLKEIEESIRNGTFEGAKPHKEVNVMEIRWDLGLWAIVVFLILFTILRTKAWGPILEGLQKREEHIRLAVEEAKNARAETARMQAQVKAEMDAKFAEVPKIMEEARRDAEALKEELRSQATKEITADRQRLRREIEVARDQALKEIWEQAAQLATLISAKVIGKSLSEDDHRRLIDESLRDLRDASPSAGR